MGHHSRPRGSTLLLRSCGSTSAPSTTAATASLPNVREPGEKLGPIARMPTNADAQSTTVTSTAAMPAALMPPDEVGVAADGAELVGDVEAMLPI